MIGYIKRKLLVKRLNRELERKLENLTDYGLLERMGY